MKTLTKLLALGALTSLLAAATAYGQFNLTFDEWGNSTYQPGQLMPDPTGGVLNWNVLVYNLPFAGLPGDVLMYDPVVGTTNYVLGDVLRFDGNGHMIFYS